MSTADLLEQLRVANPAPRSDLVDIDDIALLAAIDERYAALSTVAHPAEAPPSFDEHPTVDYLRQPDESDAPPEQKGWLGVVIAVAATILVVVGVVVVADGTSDDVVTDPASSPNGAEVDGARSQTVGDVTVGGPGLVAVGSAGPIGNLDAAVWTSVDGTSWSRVSHDKAVFGGAGRQGMTSVTAAGPGLVAVGWDGSGDDLDAAVWTSTDGLTWSRVPHDEAIFGGKGGGRINSVTAGGPGLVAVGRDGEANTADAAVWTSANGITWARVPHDEAVFGGERGVQEMASVTATGFGLVAVGWDWFLPDDAPGWTSTAAVWTSANGITWARVPHDENAFAGEWFVRMNDVTAGGPGLVAVGRDGAAAVWTSVDGITWARVPNDEELFGEDCCGYPPELASVTSTSSGLVAVGPEFLVWTSDDGTNWSRVPYDEEVFGGEVRIESVTTGGPGLVAVGAEDSNVAMWTSVDGITWSRVPHVEATGEAG